VEFTYTITNTGDLALTDVTIEDSFGNVIEIGELLTGTVTVRTVTQVINTTTTNLAGVSAIASNESVAELAGHKAASGFICMFGEFCKLFSLNCGLTNPIGVLFSLQEGPKCVFFSRAAFFCVLPPPRGRFCPV
jgi:hypothetical protein